VVIDRDKRIIIIATTAVGIAMVSLVLH